MNATKQRRGSATFVSKTPFCRKATVAFGDYCRMQPNNTAHLYPRLLGKIADLKESRLNGIIHVYNSWRLTLERKCLEI